MTAVTGTDMLSLLLLVFLRKVLACITANHGSIRDTIIHPERCANCTQLGRVTANRKI